jgi:hypothetical protein
MDFRPPSQTYLVKARRVSEQGVIEFIRSTWYENIIHNFFKKILKICMSPQLFVFARPVIPYCSSDA